MLALGFYGLKAARTYLDLEPRANLAVFDGEESVGGVWCKNRIYPNLVAQVAIGYFNYPGTPMPNDEKGGHLIRGEMVQHYLEKFAVDNDLMPHIRLNSWVKKVERCPRGWRLRVNDSYIETTKLILCCGVASVPSDPPFRVEPGAKIIHSREIAPSVSAIEDAENFVLVGAAKSAYDVAYYLCSKGKRVTWIIRPDGGGPMPLVPLEIGGIDTIAMGSTRLMSYLSPSMYNTKGILGTFFHRTAVGQWLTKANWNFMSSVSDKAAGFGGDAGAAEGLKPDLSDRR
jgi:dimethylaniline monooxygenase (N-oxide forming)